MSEAAELRVSIDLHMGKFFEHLMAMPGRVRSREVISMARQFFDLRYLGLSALPAGTGSAPVSPLAPRPHTAPIGSGDDQEEDFVLATPPAAD